MKRYNVCIADDHTMFRKAMASLIKSFPVVGSVREAENGANLIDLIKAEKPDVAIIDLEMPVMNGSEAASYIINKFPEVKIIILTMHDADQYVLYMMELGVHAFLMKNAEPEELEKALVSVVEKDFYHNDLVANILRKNLANRRQVANPFRKADLSDRERDVLKLICQEYTMKEISARLSLSEHTIRNHRANIMEKTGTKNTVGLVRFAYEVGILL